MSCYVMLLCMTSITVPNYSFLLGVLLGVMTQTRHTFEFQSGKSVRAGICTIVRVKKRICTLL